MGNQVNKKYKKRLERVRIIENSKGVIAYDCDKVFYIKLEKGAVVSGHSHLHKETVFLMEGEAEMVIGDETQKIKASIKLEIPPNAYHKFTAITDVIGLEMKERKMKYIRSFLFKI